MMLAAVSNVAALVATMQLAKRRDVGCGRSPNPPKVRLCPHRSSPVAIDGMKQSKKMSPESPNSICVRPHHARVRAPCKQGGEINLLMSPGAG